MSKQITAQDTETISDAPLFPLGQVAVDIYGREWQYCIANGALSAGGAAIIATDGTFDASPCDTSTAGTPGTHWKFLGIPNVAVTDNYYAWFFIGKGEFEILLEAYHAAADVIYTTSTAPYLGNDDTSFQVEGVKSIDATTTAARATCWVADRMTVGVVEAND
jgi:hypothetical protein